MFVASNSIRSVIDYFERKLTSDFSVRECRIMAKAFIRKRLALTEHDLVLSSHQGVSESDLLYFRSAVKRLLDHQPFQYVLGETYFYGLTLKVNQAVLIPRPETEELVDWVLEDSKMDKLNVLDIGTGSGCISLALKAKRKAWEISAVDVDDDALELAKDNGKTLGLDVNFYKMDISDAISKSTKETYDLIVSNPPYIPVSEKKEMAKHVVEHEPEVALFVADDDPFLFYKKISSFAWDNLAINGKLYFEIHESKAQEIKDILELSGWEEVTIREDLQDKERMMRAIKP